MPLGFRPEVSEDGGLSGGQKQRLAIARALLSKQPILIFDEATVVDSDTESRVMANLAKIKRTMIFIAHRNSVRQHVSRVVTMGVVRLSRTVLISIHSSLFKNLPIYM